MFVRTLGSPDFSTCSSTGRRCRRLSGAWRPTSRSSASRAPATCTPAAGRTSTSTTTRPWRRRRTPSCRPNVLHCTVMPVLDLVLSATTVQIKQSMAGTVVYAEKKNIFFLWKIGLPSVISKKHSANSNSMLRKKIFFFFGK